MPERFERIAVPGPYNVIVTVETRDGMRTQHTTISDAVQAVSPVGEDVIAYEAMKNAKRAYRTIVREHVVRALPNADERTRGFVMRTTWAGHPYVEVPSAEELAGRKIDEEMRLRRFSYRVWQAALNFVFPITGMIMQTVQNLDTWMINREPK